ncbi:hypothetical protein CJF30_00001900 [Rutstroemia sp. NJR-2017a BBW]|nr:hypothetical protein CJF30_00001900 [Rutstroemia sp. NJR-2017a BBW]
MLIRDNEKLPDSVFLPVFGFEYKDPADFYNLISSDEFLNDVGQMLKSFATARTVPGIYESDVSPKEVFTSPVSEVFRIKIHGDQAKEATARAEWENFTKKLNGKKVLSGVSINLEERLFLGIVGWESLESRTEVEELKKKDLDWEDSFVVAFST